MAINITKQKHGEESLDFKITTMVDTIEKSLSI